MKKHFLNIGLLFAIGLATVAFVSCKTDKADESFVIKAENVINSSAEIATVKIKLPNEEIRGELMPSLPFLQTPFQNNGFELTLSGSIPIENMRFVTEEFNDYGFEFNEFFISDTNAKWFQLTDERMIQTFDENDNQIGIVNFVHTSENENEWRKWRVGWIYVDRDVVVRIEEEFDNEINVQTHITSLVLLKGWNTVYMMTEVISSKGKLTTVMTADRPFDVSFEWVAINEVDFISEAWMRIFDMWQNFPYLDE